MWKGTTETQPIDHVATGHRRSQNTRRTICFPFPNLLWPRWLGVADAAQERGVNLICLAQANTSAPPVTESQANVLYDLVKTGRVVESLYFREAHLGFALCEVGPRDDLVYEALRRQLGSALWGTLLLQKHERTEEALRGSEEMLRLIFENAFDGISLYEEYPGDGTRTPIDCNRRYAEIAGRSKQALLETGNTLPIQEVHGDDLGREQFLRECGRGCSSRSLPQRRPGKGQV